MHTVGRLAARRASSRAPSPTRFIPIALAYLVAHYFSLVVFQEQAQFTYLLSDPLGDGSDLFGTAGGGDRLRADQRQRRLVRPGRPRSSIGHVAALTLAHDRALAIYGEIRTRAALAVLDARGDGRLHLPRALPALAGERHSDACRLVSVLIAAAAQCSARSAALEDDDDVARLEAEQVRRGLAGLVSPSAPPVSS